MSNANKLNTSGGRGPSERRYKRIRQVHNRKPSGTDDEVPGDQYASLLRVYLDLLGGRSLPRR